MTSVRFVGSGGQGIQSAAVILAEAAIADGGFVACTHTYGPESRGGASRADVLIDDAEIVYPRIGRPDALVVLSADGGRHVDALADGGVLICDRSVAIAAPPGADVLALPIIETARSTGSTQGANMVALGALCAVTGIVSRDALVAAVAARLRGSAVRNQRALDAGIALAARIDRSQIVAAGGPR